MKEDTKPIKEITKYWRQRRFANLLKAGVITVEEGEKQ